jgi:hypothetical protein
MLVVVFWSKLVPDTFAVALAKLASPHGKTCAGLPKMPSLLSSASRLC